MPLQALAVEVLVISDSIFPATEENADPLVSQGSNGGVVSEIALTLLQVVGAQRDCGIEQADATTSYVDKVRRFGTRVQGGGLLLSALL